MIFAMIVICYTFSWTSSKYFYIILLWCIVPHAYLKDFFHSPPPLKKFHPYSGVSFHLDTAALCV